MFKSSRLPLLLTLVLLRPLANGAAAPPSKPPTTDYMIVVTGSELLQGAYADGHTHFLTRTMHPLGLRCVGSMSVNDRQTDIKAALRFATGRTELVIVTGGLGPTDNDVTRQALAAFTGMTLREHPDVVRELKRRFKATRDQLRPNLQRQTQVPSDGTYLSNPIGTAVGLVFESADFVIVALPGPPRELQPMVRDELVPYLDQRFDLQPAGCSLTVRFVGIGQSRIDQTLKDHVPLPAEMILSSQFERGRVDFTFSVPDNTPQLRAQLQELKQQVLHRLGDYVYATDGSSLEERIVTLLESRGQRLAIAEVGSGGRLTAGFSAADGAQRVLAGAFVAPTEEKLRRLLGLPDDEPVGTTSSGGPEAEVLARAAADLTGSQWACVVGEARPDASGARFVRFAVRTPGARVESQRVPLRARDSRHTRLVTQLLDRLRRQLK